jgi:hypothetical protein
VARAFTLTWFHNLHHTALSSYILFFHFRPCPAVPVLTGCRRPHPPRLHRDVGAAIHGHRCAPGCPPVLRPTHKLRASAVDASLQLRLRYDDPEL